jgi:sugar/nucleoside kinase (ribokinase family)
MSQSKAAVVAGHFCLDVIPNLDTIPSGKFGELFQPGQLVSVGTPVFASGGPVSNTGLALHRLGVPTQLMGKTGADAFGQIVRDIVHNVDGSLARGIVVDEASPTSYTIIISPPGVDRIFLHNPGANDTFSADDIDYASLGASHLFHFGYPPVMRRMYENDGEELAAVFRQAKASGITTSLDMTLPDPTSEGGQADWRVILGKALPYVDIFLPSIEEILFMLRRDSYDTIRAEHDSILDALTPELLSSVSDELLGMGVKIVLLKLGDRGAYLRTADGNALSKLGRAAPSDLDAWASQELWAPCFQVNVVGTTGSGDATIAGFISAFLRELSPREALTMAVAVGACNVEAADATSGLLSWEETLERVAQDWTRHPLDLSAEGWQKDEAFDLWSKQA